MRGVDSTSSSTTTPSSGAQLASSATAPHFLPDLVELFAQFLVGFDVLQLSHVCRTFRETLASREVWYYRISISPPLRRSARGWCSEQEAYFAKRSILYRGPSSIPRRTKRLLDKLSIYKKKSLIECGDATEIPYAILPRHGRVTFDLWFSLLDDDEMVERDSILFGLQSESCFSGRVPEVSQQFIRIDRERNLRCSVLPSKPVIAAQLDTHRWYHLALVFDSQRQSVYLDGECVSSGCGLGRIQDKWHWVRHAQIGTGYISESGSTGDVAYQCTGWYPFRGIVDEFRLWTDTLTEEELRALARGSDPDRPPAFALSTDAVQQQEGVRRVRCSRPKERHLVMHSPRVAEPIQPGRASESRDVQLNTPRRAATAV